MNKSIRWSVGLCLIAMLVVGLVYRARTKPTKDLFILERDGLVTIRGLDVNRIEALKQLSEKLAFDLYTGRVETKYMDLDLREQPLQAVVAHLLDGERYATENHFDSALGRHRIESVTAGFLDLPLSGGTATSAAEYLAGPPPDMATILSASASAAASSARGGNVRPAAAARTGASYARYMEAQAAPFGEVDVRAHEQAEAERVERAKALRDQSLADLDSDDPTVRADATNTVEPVKEGLRKLMKQAAQDPEDNNRQLAIEQLSKGRGFEVSTALLAALKDPSGDVVLTALDGIAQTRDPTLADRLQSALKDRADPEIQARLASTLATLHASAPTWGASEYLDRQVITESAPSPR